MPLEKNHKSEKCKFCSSDYVIGLIFDRELVVKELRSIFRLDFREEFKQMLMVEAEQQIEELLEKLENGETEDDPDSTIDLDDVRRVKQN